MQNISKFFNQLFKVPVIQVETWFNELPTGKRKIIAVMTGVTIGISCTLLILLSSSTIELSGRITRPVLPKQPDSKPKIEKMMPVGKMESNDKGAYYYLVAINVRGDFFIAEQNKNKPTQSAVWTPVTTAALERIEENYHFIPIASDTAVVQ